MATLTFNPALVADRATEAAPRKGFLARLGDALMESRERQARREIARVMEMLGDSAAAREIQSRARLPF